MDASTFEKSVSLGGATVTGGAFLRSGATFKGEVSLVGASIGSGLDMTGSTFEGPVFLTGANVGSTLQMMRSTFESLVILNAAKVTGIAFLSGGATFKGEVNLVSATIGSNLDFSAANYSMAVDLTGVRIDGELRLGSSSRPLARWGEGAALVLRNARCAALQDWWQSDDNNSWPETLELEGFTYARFGGSSGEGREAYMQARPITAYTAWLDRVPTFSPQPYEHLAGLFREAGEPEKANAILYAAKERRRDAVSAALGECKSIGAYAGTWFTWFGLCLLKWIIGYGFGGRYFRVLWWVGGLTLLGALLLFVFGSQPPESWPRLIFASLDQLLPIITLDKGHDILIFGNASADPPETPQPYWVLVYFYAHKIAGWVLGSFLVAGLAGLTQRN
jgi:hypothetical protein